MIIAILVVLVIQAVWVIYFLSAFKHHLDEIDLYVQHICDDVSHKPRPYDAGLEEIAAKLERIENHIERHWDIG